MPASQGSSVSMLMIPLAGLPLAWSCVDHSIPDDPDYSLTLPLPCLFFFFPCPLLFSSLVRNLGTNSWMEI